MPFGREFWRESRRRPDASGRRLPDHAAGQVDPVEVAQRVGLAFEGNDDTGFFHQRHPRYSARLAADGFLYAPPVGSDGPPTGGNGVALRTVFAGSAGPLEPMAVSSASAWFVRGNTAQRALNAEQSLVEHYEMRPDGVELTWLLRRPPGAAGSLTLELELAGARHEAADAEGEHYVDHLGEPLLCIGPVVAVDLTGRRWPLEARGEADRFRVEIPGPILAQASYPLAVDPLIGPEFELTQPIAGSYRLGTTPSVAASASQFLVVWSDDYLLPAIAPPPLRASRVARDGEVLDPAGLRFGEAGADAGGLAASNGRDFLVLWHGRAARVSEGGAVLDPGGFPTGLDQPVVVVSNGRDYLLAGSTFRQGRWVDQVARLSSEGVVLDAAGLPLPAGTTLALASNGRDYLALRSAGGLATVAIGADGTVGNPVGTPLAEGSFGVLARRGEGYLVVYEGPQDEFLRADYFSRRLDAAGVPLDQAPIQILTNTLSPLSLLTVGGEHQLIHVSRSYSFGRKNELSAMRLGPTGAPSGLTKLTTASGAPTGPGTRRLAAAAVGEDCLVVWPDTEIAVSVAMSVVGARLNGATGQTEFPLPISVRPQEQSFPAVAFNGENYLVVWMDRRGFSSSTLSYSFGVMGARITPGGQILDPSGIVICSKLSSQIGPRVAAHGREFFVVWADDRNYYTTDYDIYGTRVAPDGRVLDPLGLPIAIAANIQSGPVIAAGDQGYFVAWTDAREGPGPPQPPDLRASNVYGTRLGFDGAVLDPQGIAVSRANNYQAAPAVAWFAPNYLVAWMDARSAGEAQPLANHRDIYAARVASDGRVLDPEGLPVCAMPNQQFAPVIAASSSHALVVWGDHRLSTAAADLYATRMRPDGTLLDPDGIAVSRLPGSEFPTSAIDDGARYVVAWMDELVPGTLPRQYEVRWARLGYDGVLQDASTAGLDTRHEQPAYPGLASGQTGEGFLTYTAQIEATPRVFGQLLSLEGGSRVRIGKAGDSFHLRWPARPGRAYRVEYSDAPGTGRWEAFAPDIVAPGYVAEFVDADAPSLGRRFYRVAER